MFVVIKRISELLQGFHFDAISNVSGWAVLFKVLCHNRNIKLQHTTLMPKNFNDLVYKVKLLINGASRLRFALGEGQKRTYASLYYCLGLIPNSNFKFHGFAHEPSDYQLPSSRYTGSSFIQPENVRNFIDKKLRKLASGITVSLVKIQAREKGFVDHVVVAIRQLSERSANANSKTQERGWRACMISLCQNINSAEIIVPFECKPDTLEFLKVPKVDIFDWMDNYRYTIAKHFWDSRTLKDVAATFLKTPWIAKIKTLEEFQSQLLLTGEKGKQKQNRGLNRLTLNLRQNIAIPRLLYVLITLVVSSVTNKEEMENLSKLVLSKGKATIGKLFIRKVVNGTIKEDFDEKIKVKVCQTRFQLGHIIIDCQYGPAIFSGHIIID